MPTHALITITGPDRVGKGTQSRVLTRLIRSSGVECTRFEFPNYDGPIGKLIGAMLDGGVFSMDGYWEREGGLDASHTPPNNRLRGGRWHDAYPKSLSPTAMHALMTADFYMAQPGIRDALGRGHAVCDRYADVEDMVFAPIDCAGEFGGIFPLRTDEMVRSWIRNSRLGMRPSDHVIVLDGSPIPRPGETLDANEADACFQETVRESYRRLAGRYGWIVIDCDSLRDDDPIISASCIAGAIAYRLSRAGLDLPWSHPELHDMAAAVLCEGILR